MFPGFHGCDELRQILSLLVPIISHVKVQNFFQGLFCGRSDCSLSLTHCSVNLFSFSSAKFPKLSTEFCSLVEPIFLGQLFFVIIVENARTVFLESFVFIRFA